MNEVWNLERMYTGFDDPKFEADFADAEVAFDLNLDKNNKNGAI